MTDEDYSTGAVITGALAWLALVIVGITHYGWFLGGAAGLILGYVAFRIAAALWPVFAGLAALAVLLVVPYMVGGFPFLVVVVSGVIVLAAGPSIVDAVRAHVQATDAERHERQKTNEQDHR